MPQFTLDALALGEAVSPLGKAFLDGFRGYAERNNVEIEGLPKDPDVDVPPGELLSVLRNALAIFFPLLVPAASQ